MLHDFINYLYKQQYKVVSDFKFYVSEVFDDRVTVDVYLYNSSYNFVDIEKDTWEFYKNITITDDIIENFINGYYDISFEEWFVKNYIK